MKTYTFCNGVITPGIELMEFSCLGRVIFLGGDGGKHSHRVMVHLDAGNPPSKYTKFGCEGGDQIMRVMEANPLKMTVHFAYDRAQEDIWLLTEPDHKDKTKILLRIQTQGCSTSTLKGGMITRVRKLHGEPTELISGWDAKEEGEEKHDSLFIMSPGDSVAIETDKGSILLVLLYDKKKGIKTMPLGEYLARGKVVSKYVHKI